jgi:hypothetical protein
MYRNLRRTVKERAFAPSNDENEVLTGATRLRNAVTQLTTATGNFLTRFILLFCKYSCKSTKY